MSCTNFHKHSLVFSAHFTLDTQGLLGYSWNFLMFMAYLHCYWNCQTYLHCYLNCQTHWNCCLNCQTYWNCCLLQNGNGFVTITGKNCRRYLSFIWLVAKNIYQSTFIFLLFGAWHCCKLFILYGYMQLM